MGSRTFTYVDIPGAAVERTFVSAPMFGPPRPRRFQLPLMVIQGSADGPTLCVTAGIHGCEYAAIAAALEIYETVDVGRLAGRILIAPVVNTAAFWTRTPYVNPDDGLDIGATYGNTGSSISHRIGEYLTEQLYQKSDYIVDLHGGDLMEAILPHAGFTRTGNAELDRTAERLARSYGTEFVFERLEPGAFERSGISVPRVIAEAGGEGRLEQDSVRVHVNGVMNILKATNMVQGLPNTPKRQVLMHGRYEIYAEKSGFFVQEIQIGQEVNPGQRLGTLRGLDGRTREEISSTDGGVCLLVMTNPVKTAGDLLYKILRYE